MKLGKAQSILNTSSIKSSRAPRQANTRPGKRQQVFQCLDRTSNRASGDAWFHQLGQAHGVRTSHQSHQAVLLKVKNINLPGDGPTLQVYARSHYECLGKSVKMCLGNTQLGKTRSLRPSMMPRLLVAAIAYGHQMPLAIQSDAVFALRSY